MVATTTTDSPTRMRWLIVALIFCMGMITFIDRMNISIAAKYIMLEYGLSDVQMGWIFSAFVLGYAIFQVPGGWLGDRFGPRRVLTGALCWWSLFTAATAVAGDLFLSSMIGVVGSFALVRVLFAIGEAGGWPNYNRVVANWVSPEEHGLALGIITSGVGLGAALTPPLMVWIMETLGWRAGFYLTGGMGFVFAAIWYWLATDFPAEHPWVNAAEEQYITQPQKSPLTQSCTPVPWRMILRRGDLWFLAAAYFALGYIGYLYFSWFYLYLVNVRGFSLLSGGIYSMAPFMVGAVAAPFGGWVLDKLSERLGKRIGRCGIGLGGLLLTAGLIFAGAAAPNPYTAVLLLSLGAGFLYSSTAAYFAAAIDLVKPYAGTVSGFVNMSGNLGGAISPTLTPLLAQHFGWESALYVAAALALLGAFCWVGVHPERAIELEEVALSQKVPIPTLKPL